MSTTTVDTIYDSRTDHSAARRRLLCGEYYRVETRCADGVVSRRRYTTLRAADRAVVDAEASGLEAAIYIRRA